MKKLLPLIILSTSLVFSGCLSLQMEDGEISLSAKLPKKKTD